MCSQQRQHRLQRGRTSRTTLSRIVRPSSSAYMLLSLFLLYITTIRDDCHFKFSGAVYALALTPRLAKKSREARYFTDECLIPPLEPYNTYENITTHSDKIHLGPLPVVYTNDPRTVAQWLSEHVQPSRGCTIGFDVEVSITCSVGACVSCVESFEESKY